MGGGGGTYSLSQMGGVGRWIKTISSNDIMCHALSHPLSHRIWNIFEEEACANRKWPQLEPQTMFFCYSGWTNWEKAFGRRHLRWPNAKWFGRISDYVGSSRIISNHLDLSGVHLEASAIIWGHLRSSGVVCVHLGSPGIVWDHPGSSGIISGLIWDLLEELSASGHLKRSI